MHCATRSLRSRRSNCAVLIHSWRFRSTGLWPPFFFYITFLRFTTMENNHLTPRELQGNYDSGRSNNELRNSNSSGAAAFVADEDCDSITHKTPRNSIQQEEALIFSNETELPRMHNVVENHEIVLAAASDSGEVDCDRKMERPPLQRIRLDHSVYSLVLVALYATLMVFAWVVICIIAHRPIMSSMNHYGQWRCLRFVKHHSTHSICRSQFRRQRQLQRRLALYSLNLHQKRSISTSSAVGAISNYPRDNPADLDNLLKSGRGGHTAKETSNSVSATNYDFGRPRMD